MTDKKGEDLSRFYTRGLPLLKLMLVFAITGIVLALICNYFF
jgi:hypothetical protein